VRVPLLGRDVIDVAWRTDWRSCLDLRTRTGKRVLRDALARRVKHQTAAKRGFTVPMGHWLRTSLRPLVEALLLSRSNLLDTPIRPGAINAIYAQLCAGDESKAWGVWLLLSLALWQRKYGSPS
jgi:asparagine synthase (glutamine-hydrolysing)